MTNYDLELKKGNYGYDVNFTVTQGGAAKNLTEYTVTWKVWNNYGLHLSQVCTLVQAVAGTCKYTVQDGDFDDEATYEWELGLTKSGAKVDTETYSLVVKPTAPSV